MKLTIRSLSISDILRITQYVYSYKTTFVKYRDGTSGEVRIIFLTHEEAMNISTEVSMCRWENHDYCGGKLAEIPGFLGFVNGFVLVADRCERYIDNGVIDLIKIEIDRKIMQQRIEESLKHTRIPNLEN